MAVNYQVVLKNQAGSRVAIFDDWVNLRFVRTVNGLSAFTYQISGADNRISLFELDGQLEVYRSDVVQGIPRYLEFESLIRAFEYRTEANGSRYFTVEGRGYSDLLSRRITAYFSTSAQADKSGPVETVMKEFVDDNAGPGATSPPRIADGVTAGLVIQADGAAGATWSGGRAYRNLLDVLQDISHWSQAHPSHMDFDVVGTGGGAYEFRTYEHQRGADRTIDGLSIATGLNGAGNTPVTFSVLFGNMSQPVYRDTRLSEVNRVFVLGPGDDLLRSVVVRSNIPRIADSPVNQREIGRDARNESTAAGLDAKGDALLHELTRQQSFEFKFIPTAGTQYGRDFFFGDRVTARYDTIQVNKKIVSVTIGCKSPGSENIEIEFEDLPR